VTFLKLFWTQFRTKESRDGRKLKNHPENFIIIMHHQHNSVNSVEVIMHYILCSILCTTLVENHFHQEEAKLEVMFHLPTIG
jgi:hypothetical protein